ncbi:MAG: hydrogenase nickel incorporation protein HypB [Candidatus Fermentibacteraceae bacterium]|nr:hydrogenase nickel incorporation protein HypB [Candidatus Fermentibacteraceae bacterium]
MCEDCGCEEGNARAYFEHNHDHNHTHDVHSHEHDSAGSGGIHLHIYADSSVDLQKNGLHVHIHLTGDQQADHVHDHNHDHHHHEHIHETEQESRATREIVLESRVLARNDQFAEKNRAFLKQQGCVAVNFISSPGSGKTYLLEKTLEGLRGRVKCAVIAGDQQTDNDALRLREKGAPVVQIETGSSCHLNAEQIGETLEQVLEEDTELLFIENVGNLVCPAAFDLGENIKIALLSVTEGEDKPLKYPVIFHDAAASVVTKTDLIEHLDVDMGRYRDSLNKIQPGGRIFELSALTGTGMDAWLDYLEGLAH